MPLLSREAGWCVEGAIHADCTGPRDLRVLTRFVGVSRWSPPRIVSHVPEDDAIHGAMIIRYSGIYNADGGMAGEIRYLFGHIFGTAECALCDISHSPLHRKPEWDRMVARMSVPLVALHRNEIDERLRAAVRGVPLPVVVAHHCDESISVALTADQLARLGGSVEEFERALLEGLQRP